MYWCSYINQFNKHFVHPIDSKHPSAQFHHIRPREVDQHHTIWFESQYWMNTVISYHHCGHTRKPTPITWFDILQYSATYQRSWGSRKSSWCFQWWPLCTLDWPNPVGLVFGGSEYDPGYEDGATLLLTYNRIKKTRVFSLDYIVSFIQSGNSLLLTT